MLVSLTRGERGTEVLRGGEQPGRGSLPSESREVHHQVVVVNKGGMRKVLPSYEGNAIQGLLQGR